GARAVSERSGARAASERSGARPASERSGAAAATSERGAAKPIAAHPVVVPVEPAPQPESAPAIVFPAPGANDPVVPVREVEVAPAVAPLRTIGSAARTSTGSHELAVRPAASPDRPRRRGVIAGVALLAVAIVAAVWVAAPGDAPPPVPVADATPIDPPPPPGPPRAEASGDPRPSPPAPIVDAPPVDPIAAVTHGAGEPVAPSDAALVPDADDAIDPQEVPSTAVAAASTSDVVVAELIARANDSRRAGRTGDAVSAYRDVLARQPGNLEALSAMARIAFDRGAFADAVTWGRRLVAVAPSSAKGRLALGDAYFKLGRLAEAEAQYRKADRLGHRLADSRLAAVGAK
ncbi:MAG: tetratricopeptide repeat protein, partial [Myxococcales bacterium]|nr:tetratricopeptide repeat protein [Myxococcales bacterium]